ncbi:MAG: conjugal transfer protein TraF [Gemmatimonadota bacterium]|jgi:hypothetical protein
MTTIRAGSRSTALLLAALSVTLSSGPAAAQLARASAADFGLGNAVTATARGFSAIAGNPAGLGMPGTGRFSLAVLPLQLRQGLEPVGLGDLADFGGRVVPDAVKEAWLADVRADGGEVGSSEAGVSGLALQAGRMGVQVSTLAAGRGRLVPDAAELLLFGNAGRSGEPAGFELAGSTLDGWAVSTVGVSFGLPIGEDPGRSLAVGATVKYSVGHAVVVGRDVGSAVGNDPLEVAIDFPVLSTPVDDAGLENGSGLGLDLGVAWERGPLRLGATAQNVLSTFAWDVDGMVFRPGTALFNEDESGSDFDERPGEEAPEALRAAVDELGFAPLLAVGGAYELGPELTVAADVQKRFGEGMGVDPDFRAAVGLEARPTPVLPLRAHVAKITGGYQLGGGLSLVLGPVTLSGGAAVQVGEPQNATMGMFTLSFGGR